MNQIPQKRKPDSVYHIQIKQRVGPHAQRLTFPSKLSILSSAWADLQRLGRSTHVYSAKHRTDSKKGEVQAVRDAVVRLCTGFFVVITASHMAANCGHAECESLSLLLCVLIETVHNVSTCFF